MTWSVNLQKVVWEEPHDGEKAELVDEGVDEPDEEAGGQDGDLGHLNWYDFEENRFF